MKVTKTNSGYTDDVLFERAAKFSSRSDLKKYDNKAYQALWRRNLLDRACANMKPSLTEAYTFEEMAEEAKKYLAKMDFRKANQGMYDVAYKRGVLAVICSHMPEHIDQSGENHPNFKWPLSLLRKIAKKYERKIDFYNNEPKAYAAAYVRGCLEEICSEMKDSYRNWTDEEIFKAFQLCSSRGEVQKKFSRAYHAAREKGEDFLNKMSSHFKKTGGTSIAEKEILQIIKNYFPEAKKLHRTKVSIPDKPFIKSFDIDVYVESIGKGIEYDGTRYHSFEYMRKDHRKKLWSDDDIRSYHEIKDAAFIAKNIVILHIKEEEWESNKEVCIKRIKDFLGVEG